MSFFVFIIGAGLGSYFFLKYMDKKVKSNPYYIKDFLIKNKDLSFGEVTRLLSVKKGVVIRIAKKYKIKSKFKFGGNRLK